MPATQTVHACDICNLSYKRHKMSPFEGLCSECFDRSYCLCSVCGCLLYRQHVYGGPLARPLSAQRHGDNFCPSCADPEPSHGWRPSPSQVSCASYDQIGSTRKYGVEIETSYCHGWPALKGQTIFGAKGDCSISGMEFDSPILYGDEGFDVITALLDYADDKGWAVDSDCGTHIHLDMRNETEEQVVRVTYAYRLSIMLWQRFVPEERRNRTYTHTPRWRAADLRDLWEGRLGRARRQSGLGVSYLIEDLTGTRYENVNLLAYLDHKTIEVRMLEGTLDVTTICNWITCHARFIDAVKDLTFDEIDRLFSGDYQQQFDALAGLLDADLVRWLKGRWRRHSPETYEAYNANA